MDFISPEQYAANEAFARMCLPWVLAALGYLAQEAWVDFWWSTNAVARYIDKRGSITNKEEIKIRDGVQRDYLPAKIYGTVATGIITYLIINPPQF